MSKFLGWMYIGKKTCGCLTGMTWDDPERKKETAKFVGNMVRRGDSIKRLRRFEGDAVPPLYCKRHVNKPA